MYIYTFIADGEEDMKIYSTRKIISPKGNARGKNIIFWGNKSTYLLNDHAINCISYRTACDYIEYIRFKLFINSCKAKKVVNVYLFLSV